MKDDFLVEFPEEIVFKIKAYIYTVSIMSGQIVLHQVYENFVKRNNIFALQMMEDN